MFLYRYTFCHQGRQKHTRKYLCSIICLRQGIRRHLSNATPTRLFLGQFAKDFDAPDVLVCDPHPTQKQCKVKDFCTQIGTTLKVLEAQTQWANRAELYIGLIKEDTRKDMRASGSPLVLWDYCMERLALIYFSAEWDNSTYLHLWP